MPSLFAADRSAEKTPVFVLTGFLGSGKTTLLNRLLGTARDTAVIVNELGEVALDHLLVQPLDGEVALLQGNCVCCVLRSDFETTLRGLLAARDAGTLPPFTRVVIETTGLADPAPLVQAVDSNPLLSHFCALGAVLTTVDAVNAPLQLERQWEARKQVALADKLVVTKRDLAPDTAALQAGLAALNPHAALTNPDDPALLHPVPVHAAPTAAFGLLRPHPIGPVHDDVRALVLNAERPVDWPRLQDWLAQLRAEHGERLLRLKGVLRVAGESDPLVLHGVHHLFHPPERVPGLAWPASRSTLVLIARGLDAAVLRSGFESTLT